MNSFARIPIVAILLISPLPAQAAINPERVRLVETEPKDCKLIGKVSVDGSRLVPALKEDGVGRRAVKKAKQELDDAKKKAAALGADTLLIPKNGSKVELIGGSIKAYFCRVPDATKFDVGGSREEREDKRFVAALEVIGVATPLSYGSGLIVGMHLNPDQVLELSAAFSSAKVDDDNSYNSSSDYDSSYEMKRDGSSSIVGIRYKRFIKNSFYLHGGLALRQTKASLYAEEKYGDETTEVAQVDVSDLGPTFAIGNQWQWSAFTLGCDWLGLYVPAVRLKSSKKDLNQDKVNSSSVNKSRNDFKKGMESLNGQGVRFYVGAAF